MSNSIISFDDVATTITMYTVGSRYMGPIAEDGIRDVDMPRRPLAWDPDPSVVYEGRIEMDNESYEIARCIHAERTRSTHPDAKVVQVSSYKHTYKGRTTTIPIVRGAMVDGVLQDVVYGKKEYL